MSAMQRLCEGRVAIVTGAARGIGREHALMLAAHGASVVVNDVGGARDGTGTGDSPARQVVDEITAAGGKATVNTDDISTWDGAAAVVAHAINTYGHLDVVVNNAGILRDRMLTNMTEEEWDRVIAVHLKGTFATTRHAAAYWRERSKAGEDVDARIINTTSSSGIFGNVGQTNYGAAKAGIAAFTIIAAMELARYGVTANALAPTALTRMTEDLDLGGRTPDVDTSVFDPRWIAPICTWLASTQSRGVTGRVFMASGQYLGIAEGWHRGPTTPPVEDPELLSEIVPVLLEKAKANADMGGIVPGEEPTTV